MQTLQLGMAAPLLILLPVLLQTGLCGEVVPLELYRAVRSEEVSLTIENVDMASLPGVLSYLQTEVIGEHFPQDLIPGKAPPKGSDGSGMDGDSEVGGFVPIGFVSEDEVGLLDADEVMLEQEHPHEVDPVAQAAGALAPTPSSPPGPATAFLAAAPAPASGPDDDSAGGSRRRVRTERHRGVDVVFRAEFKVKNPPKMLASGQVSNVDFGPEIAFENGEAQTLVQGKKMVYKWDFGDFVGAAKHTDSRTPQMIPGFWLSFSGICPNVPWADKHKGGKMPDNLNPTCMVHPSGTGFLKGGLCGTSQDATPTGEIGCTYTYVPPNQGTKDVIKVDDLAGITQEDCGGRPCRDWKDFRESCTNEDYKKVFNYGRRRTITKSKYCIEYDVHPACVNGCNTKECKALKESEKDVGLPFWRGRCNPAANLNRTERLAAAFDIAGASTAHETMSAKFKETPLTCLSGNHSKMCMPDPDTGFMYCTRMWSGVCQPCYIPGTVRKHKDADQQIMCPWNVLQLDDYASMDAPKCKTTRAQDYCCLYSKTCNITVDADAATAAQSVPLDEDGYTAMTAAGSTDAMKTFLYRYHHELFGGELSDEDGLTNFAYWEWGAFPQLGHSFDKAVRGSRPFFVYPTTTTTSTTTAVTTRASTTRQKRVKKQDEQPEPEPDDTSSAAPTAPHVAALAAILLFALVQ